MNTKVSTGGVALIMPDIYTHIHKGVTVSNGGDMLV